MKTNMIGYGTFITNKMFRGKSVEVVTVNGFRRVLKSGGWFPYVLPDRDSSFKAILFTVDKLDLERLDTYEGCQGTTPDGNGLYYRTEITVVRNDGSETTAWIYIPTNDTKKAAKLSVETDPNDSWKEKIAEIAEHDNDPLFSELLV